MEYKELQEIAYIWGTDDGRSHFHKHDRENIEDLAIEAENKCGVDFDWALEDLQHSYNAGWDVTAEVETNLDDLA